MAEQIQHLYKHKVTGKEVSLPKDSLKGPLADQYTDLGESIIVIDPNTGYNDVKLKKDVKAPTATASTEAKPKEPAKPKVAAKPAATAPATKPAEAQPENQADEANDNEESK